jgi:hypothetical protein
MYPRLRLSFNHFDDMQCELKQKIERIMIIRVLILLQLKFDTMHFSRLTSRPTHTFFSSPVRCAIPLVCCPIAPSIIYRSSAPELPRLTRRVALLRFCSISADITPLFLT